MSGVCGNETNCKLSDRTWNWQGRRLCWFCWREALGMPVSVARFYDWLGRVAPF